MSRDAQSGQVVNWLFGAPGGQRPFAPETPQDLNKLHIEQMHGVQGLLTLIDSLLNLLSSWGLKQPVDRRRGIEHDHRAARSSRTRPAVSSDTASGQRACRRSRNSANVGRSAISRSSASK